MANRDAWEQPLYRFARLLLRDDEAARAMVLKTLESGIKKRPLHIDPERLIMLQFRDLRWRILKGQSETGSIRDAGEALPPNADSAVQNIDSAKLEDVLHALPEPGRSAYALLLLDALESEWIAKLLGLTRIEFGKVVHGARLAVYRAITPQPQTAAQ